MEEWIIIRAITNSHLSPSLPIDRFRISLAKCLPNFSAQSLTV